MNTSLPWVALDESGAPLPGQCVHLDGLEPVESSPPPECVDCIREGSTWVQPPPVPHLRRGPLLRQLAAQGTPARTGARRQHPVIRSAQPDESWAWCYPEELFLTPAEAG